MPNYIQPQYPQNGDPWPRTAPQRTAYCGYCGTAAQHCGLPHFADTDCRQKGLPVLLPAFTKLCRNNLHDLQPTARQYCSALHLHQILTFQATMWTHQSVHASISACINQCMHQTAILIQSLRSRLAN